MLSASAHQTKDEDGRRDVAMHSRHATRTVESLVLDAQQGDETALSELLSRHLHLLHNVIGRALNGHLDVDDLVQDTVLQIIRGLPGLREPERFRSWAVAIAYRQVQQHLRQRHPVMPVEQLEAVADPGADIAERTVTELVLTDQRQELVRAAQWLDEPNRHLLSLWWRESAGELTRSELSRDLNLTPPHAAVRLQRKRAQLDTARIVVRALGADPRCAGLDNLTHQWNGVAGSLWRKRLGRHVRDCPACAAHARGLVPPETLLLGLSTVPLPVAVAVGGVPPGVGTAVATVRGFLARLLGLLSGKGFVAAAAIALAGGGIAYVVDFTQPPLWESVTIVDPPVPSPIVPSQSPFRSAQPIVTSSPSAAVTEPADRQTWSGVNAGDVYVAPGGSDQGDGSRRRPFATLNQAVAVVRPGQTIALRGGTYRLTEPIEITISGTAGRRITLSNYRGEHPVIDARSIPADKWAITQEANYWNVKGLELKNAPTHAYVCLACQYDIFQRLSMHDNGSSGLLLRNDATIGNQVLDSDFYNNHNPADGGSAGIGLGIKFGEGAGNRVRGNRAFNNADDGFNLGDFHSSVTLEDNWAYGNGVNRWKMADWHSNGNGFSLGGGDEPVEAAHVLSNNAAWDNSNRGFDALGNTAAMVFRHNTAWQNQAVGFNLAGPAAKLTNNVAVDNGSPVSADVGTGNSWNTGEWSTESFASTDPDVAQGSRSADGSLPRTNFLRADTDAGASLEG